MSAVKDVEKGMRIKDVAKKYDISVFTVYKWLRKDDLSAKPRKGSTKLKEEKKTRPNLRKESKRFRHELRLLDLEAHSPYT
ncbi:helix-turn-helix domain-containing protein [Saccharolobus islandicus]|uniref:helix-turn-helix domain-containing protein n=1 Tax=Saccharolobus islandicus TaxID=43080 RepID=UPI003907FD7F